MTKKDIILDSSILMVLSRAKLSETLPLKSLLAQYNVVVPKAIVRELEKLAKGGSNKAKNARTALAIARSYKVIEEESGGNVDDIVLEVAQKRNAAVATLDAELIANLKAIDIPVITLQKNRLTGLDDV